MISFFPVNICTIRCNFLDFEVYSSVGGGGWWRSREMSPFPGGVDRRTGERGQIHSLSSRGRKALKTQR